MKLTVIQAAERAGVCATIIYGWLQARLLPFYRVGSAGRRGKYLIEENDLASFLESCRVEPQRPVSSKPRKQNKPTTPTLKHLKLRLS